MSPPGAPPLYPLDDCRASLGGAFAQGSRNPPPDGDHQPAIARSLCFARGIVTGVHRARGRVHRARLWPPSTPSRPTSSPSELRRLTSRASRRTAPTSQASCGGSAWDGRQDWVVNLLSHIQGYTREGQRTWCQRRRSPAPPRWLGATSLNSGPTPSSSGKKSESPSRMRM
jgi:hypothetical protein